MSRVRRADRCNDRHYERGQPHVCGKRRGHTGPHAAGRVTWARRIEPPSPNSSAAFGSP